MAYTTETTNWSEETPMTPEDMNRVESNIKALKSEALTISGNKTFSGAVDIEGISSTITSTTLLTMNQTNATAGDYYSSAIEIKEPGSYYLNCTGTLDNGGIGTINTYGYLQISTDVGYLHIPTEPLARVFKQLSNPVSITLEGATCLNPGTYRIHVDMDSGVSSVNLTLSLNRVGRFAGGPSL